MAYRWLIYSTGTTFAGTITGEVFSLPPQPYYYTDFVIPEIQPLYLWRVNNVVTPSGVIPNTDANIDAYKQSIAPPPAPNDYISYGEVTGLTAGKINTVTGATDNIAIFTADGNLQDGGYTIPELTGLTTYTFTPSGSTQIFQTGNAITIYSTPATGTTVTWNDVTSKPAWLTGTTIQAFETGHKHDQYLTNVAFTGYSATTSQRLQGIENDIVYLSGITSGLTADISKKTDLILFTGFTASTEQEFINVYGEIDYVSGQTLTKSVFGQYTGNTQPILNAALTGATDAGTGTTLITSVGSRVVTLKTISAVGGVTLLGDGNNIIISGKTGGMTSVAWGDISGGTVSDQTDLWQILTGMTGETATKLDIVVFTGYTANTDQRLQGIENDIIYLSGQTDLKLNKSVFTGYTATTAPILAAALTGATNGLTASNRVVELGGGLTKDTLISGTTYGLTANTKNITLQAINGINIIDTDGAGGVNIISDAGTIALIGNTNLGVEKTKLEISATQMLITDSRTGSTKTGFEYAGDYSLTFVDNSLITKKYADTIASGLIPKAAVLVATTGAITLSGLTTIDGIALANGDRVLVKNQASAINNGIYVASASTWTRATDFDDVPGTEVVSGNIVPVVSGNTNHNTLWVLVTPNPIQVGTDPLNFTLFASPMSYVAGVGIDISGNTISVDGASLAGSSILWSGNTFNVDPTSGTLSTALSKKLDVTTFTGYTASTSGQINNKLNISTFTGYTATTAPILSGALTGATNGLHFTGRNVGLGGNLTGDTTIDGVSLHDLTIANIKTFQVATDGVTGTTFGLDKAGFLFEFSGGSLTFDDKGGLKYGGNYSSAFTSQSLVDVQYVTGLTAALQADIDYISGVTDANFALFTGYTATTKNKDKKIQLVSTTTGDTNTVSPTAIIWNSASPHATDIYTWTGGSAIKILSAGTYEVQYHVTLKNSAANQTHSVGGYIVRTTSGGTSTITKTATAAMIVGPNTSGELSLPPVVITLTVNDVLVLQAFRIGNTGSVYSVSDSVYLVLNKLT
jgi:hypothetical protein